MSISLFHRRGEEATPPPEGNIERRQEHHHHHIMFVFLFTRVAPSSDSRGRRIEAATWDFGDDKKRKRGRWRALLSTVHSRSRRHRRRRRRHRHYRPRFCCPSVVPQSSSSPLTSIVAGLDTPTLPLPSPQIDSMIHYLLIEFSSIEVAFFLPLLSSTSHLNVLPSKNVFRGLSDVFLILL